MNFIDMGVKLLNVNAFFPLKSPSLLPDGSIVNLYCIILFNNRNLEVYFLQKGLIS